MEKTLQIRGMEEHERRLVERLAREKNHEKASRLSFNLRLTRAMLAASKQLVVNS